MIGIIAAMNSEYRLFRTKKNELFNGAKFKIVKSGVGPQAAANAALHLINSGCNIIMGWGFAGGLSAEFKCGQIIIANRFVAENIHYYSPTLLHQEFMKRLQALNPAEGTILASDKPIFSAKKKQNLAKELNAVAVDMESLGIISVTKQKAIPYFSVRVILDDSNTTLPAWIAPLLKEKKSINKAILLSKKLFNVTEIYKLIRLALLYKQGAIILHQISKQLSK